jgi:hypothetical protein
MNRQMIIEGGVVVLLAIGAVGFAATAPAGRVPVEVSMPTINQGTSNAGDNSRECEPGVVDVNCVYL